jgi:bacterioferritin (cytochrome b1)
MQGHPEVVDYLKDLLRGELAARDQYFAHSRIYEDQGLPSCSRVWTMRCRKKPSTPTHCCAAS